MARKALSVVEIKPRKGWRRINLAELWEYRDLLFSFVSRDVKVLYKQTVLGFSWAIIRPVFSMVVFSVVFGRLAEIPSDDVPYPIFSFAALIPWTYFSSAVAGSTQSLVGNANMIGKVYFPRLIIPLAPVLAGLVDFAIAFCVLALMMAWYGIAPSWEALFLPLLALLMILTAWGTGMWLSAMGVKYRDVRHAVTFFVQILMYAAPVVWPASLIPEKYRLIYGLYPMAGVIEGFRSALLGTNPMPWDLILAGAFSSLCIAATGMFYFRRVESSFADVA